MFLFGFAVGTLAAGAAMYYIQPTVKVAVAKTFLGAAALNDYAIELQHRAEAVFSAADAARKGK